MLVKTPSLPIPVGGRLSGDNVMYPTHMVWFSDIPLCAIEKAQRDRFGSEFLTNSQDVSRSVMLVKAARRAGEG